MSGPIAERDRAERLLTAALGGDPELTETNIEDLMEVAGEDFGDGTVYTASGLNRAATLGWNWKAALTAEQYDIAGGGGRELSRAEWHEHCFRMAHAYATGRMDVTAGTRGGASGTVGLTTRAAQARPRPRSGRAPGQWSDDPLEGAVINE